MNEPAPDHRPRDRRRRATRQRILDQAMAMVVEGGFDGLSINRLAAALDYTPGALYRYFDSKDALVSALVTTVIDDIAADVRHALTGAGSPLAGVVAAAEVWRRLAIDAPHRFGLVSMLLATPRLVLADPEYAAEPVAAMLVALRPVVGALETAAQAGALSPGLATDRALLLFAGVHGALQLRKQASRAPDLIDLDRLFAGMLRALMIGWGAAAAAVDAALSTPPTA